MALPTLSILLFFILIPTFSARISTSFMSLPQNMRSANRGLSFSVPVYHRSRNSDQPPASNLTVSSSEVNTHLRSNHEDLLVMSVGIGSIGDGLPMLTTELTIDTASTLVWLQAQPCQHCYDQGSFPYYDSSASTTYRPVYCRDFICGTIALADRNCQDGRWDAVEPCSYNASYADETSSRGVIGTDTFYFQNTGSLSGLVYVSVENVPFGLGTSNYLPKNIKYKDSVPGIAGFVRGYGGLLQTLGVTKFSHCFPRDKDGIGMMRFGDEVKIVGQKIALSQESRYYMALLTNVYVSGKQINTGPDMPAEIFFDTGSTITDLEPRILDAIIAAIKSALGQKYRPHKWKDYELCYDLISLCSVSLDEVAKITFEFNYSTKFDLFSFHLWIQDMDHKEICLGFHRAKSGRNTFGNNLMREVNIAYSLDQDEYAMFFNHQHCR